MKQLRYGAHISIASGLTNVLEKTKKMGANTIQIFASPPQSFQLSRFLETECATFKQQTNDLDIQPIFIHAKYLINLASESKRLRRLSIESLIDDLELAEKIGAVGSIVHTGSHKGKGFGSTILVVVDAIREVLKNTPQTSKLMLEIASGGYGKIGSSLNELATILYRVGSPRLGVCLDTAHMFASGLAFDTEVAVERLSRQIEQTVSWAKVWCMHVNDSKAEFGSGVDRHENLGQGKIGLAVFKNLFRFEKFCHLPLILETPGFAAMGPDKDNLEILKQLLELTHQNDSKK